MWKSFRIEAHIIHHSLSIRDFLRNIIEDFCRLYARTTYIIFVVEYSNIDTMILRKNYNFIWKCAWCILRVPHQHVHSALIPFHCNELIMHFVSTWSHIILSILFILHFHTVPNISSEDSLRTNTILINLCFW